MIIQSDNFVAHGRIADEADMAVEIDHDASFDDAEFQRIRQQQRVQLTSNSGRSLLSTSAKSLLSEEEISCA